MGSQAFIARDYDVFAGLDVDKKSISVTFTDHQGSVSSCTECCGKRERRILSVSKNRNWLMG